MPAPVQLDLLRRQPPKRRTAKLAGPPVNLLPEPSELQIQIALVARLRLQCRPGIIWWHTPNGEWRDDKTAAKLKAMGTRPGVADLQFVFACPAPTLFLELKARGRKLTEAQEMFRDQMRGAGHAYEWADNIDDAVRILRNYNIVP
jgi:hypothetical protein